MKNSSFLKLKIVVLSTLFIILSGCSSDEITSLENRDYLSAEESIETRSSGDYLSTEESIIVGLSYLELNEEDNSYSFTMTLEEARKLNISKKEYLKMVEDIKNTNTAILDMKKEGIDFHLPTPPNPETVKNNNIIDGTSVRLKTGSESPLPTHLGGISTYDQNWGTTQFYIPTQIQRVHVRCYGGGLGTLYNVYIGSYSASGIGWLGVWTTDLHPFSNDTPISGFKTSNSNGGSCAFDGYSS